MDKPLLLFCSLFYYTFNNAEFQHLIFIHRPLAVFWYLNICHTPNAWKYMARYKRWCVADDLLEKGARWQFQIFRRKMYHGFEFSFPWSGELLIDMHDQTLKSDQFHLWRSLQQHNFRSIFLVECWEVYHPLYSAIFFQTFGLWVMTEIRLWADIMIMSWDSQKSMDKKMRGWNSALLQV